MLDLCLWGAYIKASLCETSLDILAGAFALSFWKFSKKRNKNIKGKKKEKQVNKSSAENYLRAS